MGSYVLPALAGSRPVIFPRSPQPIWPGLRRSLGVEDRTASRCGYALTFDDGPHAQGTPAVLEILAVADVRATFFLVGEQLRRNPTLGCEIVAAGHADRPALRPPPQPAAPGAVAGARGHRPCAGYHRGCDRPLAEPVSPPVWRAQRHGAARGARAWLAHAAVEPLGRDWEARATPESIAARVTDGAGEGAVLLLHDADDYSAPDSWRRTVAALPRVLDTLAQRGLQPVAP